MKKILRFLRIHLIPILLIFITLIALYGLVYYVFSGMTNYNSMETFQKRQILGQTIAQLPMMLIYVSFFVLGTFAVQYFIMSGGVNFGFSKKELNTSKMDVRLSDVIGMEEAKKDAMEIIHLLKNQQIVKNVGGKIIKGGLLIGPPGCGKTYLAKAIASECGLPMVCAVGSEFVAMFVGQGAARIRSIFKQARKLAEIHGGCIIFIDEIDSFARPRSTDLGFGGTSSMNATINQFLTEMDGLQNKEANIVVLAATNVNEEELDPAIMRSGRFDRKIRVEKPNTREREAIIRYYLGKVGAEPNLDLEKLADKCKWFSPSDISNMVREASIIALRDKRGTIRQSDLDTAVKRLMESIEKMGGDKILGDRVNVKWNQVIGMTEAKQEAWEIVELLRDRHRLQKVGGKIVKGILMLGPPGCGKTYLAKAMATESGFPFISRSGSEFIEVWVGLGAKRVREMFEEARRLARAEGGCIIFIDEIDTIAQSRILAGSASHGEHNSTINQLLTEMDGLRQAENNIIIMAATNAPEESLDSAITRAGRFERKIYVTRPNLKEREELFDFYLAKVEKDDDVKSDVLARKTLWFSPADIDNMIREAGIIALRDKREHISFKDLSMAYDRVVYGSKSNIVMSEHEKEWTAYHEAGHAIIGYILNPTDDVIKATIIPRKGALGFVAPRPREEIHIHDREWYLARIKTCVASYAAEMIKYGSTGSGVGGGPGADFHTAMEYARQMVWSLGMGTSGLIGDFTALQGNWGQSYLSEKTKERLTEDMQNILQNCLAEVKNILTDKRDLLDYFAQQLVEKGELEYDEIEEIFKKFNVAPLTRKPLEKDTKTPEHKDA